MFFSEELERLQVEAAGRPNDAGVLCELGNALVRARRPAEGAVILRRAIRLAEEQGRLYSNLGLALGDLGRFDEARDAFLEAIVREPDWAPAHNNLAQLYIMMGRHEDAVTCADVALAIEPSYAPARKNRALAYLAMGDFADGWIDYDWCALGHQEPSYPQPSWRGEPLAGKHLLLTAHQGLGDALQFIRYAAMLRRSAGRITLEIPLPLAEVVRSCDGIDEVIIQGQPLPQADLCVPLMALPRLFHTRLETIPAQTPYLRANPQRIARWRDYLNRATAPGERLVGIAWQGNPHHQWDQFRSARLRDFEPLVTIPGVRLVSLQRGPGIEQIPAFQEAVGNAILVPTDGEQSAPADLAETAAMMTLLDLIITVDTATAHLAGALARPTWLALSQACDWRWLTNRSDSPWYPTMRLFRQSQVKQWAAVFASIAEQLKGATT
ncbi:MAG: tetratricopeptide repeat protein [Phycisphaerales bacterium]|nr:tetratricopeptide repeat protein [Phycisphaerales bacterium]